MSTKTITHRRHGAPTDRYLELVREFPLRPIRSDSDLKMATAILDRLFGREDADAGEDDYVYVLASLVEAYEYEHHAIDTSDVSGLDVLRQLMEANDMAQADLAKLFGSASSASMVLNAKRPISVPQAKRLAERFGLDVGIFL